LSSSRIITFAEAINEGLRQAMRLSNDVFVFGQLVDSDSGVFHTTSGLVDEFSSNRVFDTPVAESAMTGVALGASLVGTRPVLVHQRMDFLLCSMDQIVNWAATWRYKSGGKSGVPFTIRAVVGKGWGQGPQHSKSLQAWFAHVPGLQVVMPATPADAKGLLLNAIFGSDPTIIIEGRSLFSMRDEVPEDPYRVPFGHASVRRSGSDVTVAALGHMVPLVLKAAEQLQDEGISTEVIDLRTVVPLDEGTILKSVKKTGRLIISDPAWKSFGVSGEISARISEKANGLKSPVSRLAFPDVHTPSSSLLESDFYPTEDAVVASVKAVMGITR